MALDALTRRADGSESSPVDDPTSWVSASRTRNHVLGDPLLDWLDEYGEACGLTPDTAVLGYDERTDFTPFIQSIREQSPDALFTFLPGGPPTFGFTKTYNENGLAEAGIKFLGTAETEEVNLQALGDAAIGLTTAYHYSGAHDSELNAAFTSRLSEMFPDAIANWASVGAYDGTHLIYQMVAAAGSDGPAAVEAAKTLEWESPRGPVKMDPETRTLIQNVYLREVARDEATGLLVNRETGVIATVGDLGWDK